MSTAVKSFLEKHGFYQDLDLPSLVKTFIADMHEGLLGHKAYQDMIRTYIDPSAITMQDKSVIVIDAGGTNFRSSMVTFSKEGAPTFSNFEKTKMPGIEKELSKKEFFDQIADNIERFKNTCTEICFCFSYAMTITEEADGILKSFSKEVKAPEVVGCHIGAELKKTLAEHGWTNNPKIILLNDTASALLAGSGSGKYSSYIGFILGTGLNAAYVQSERADYPGLKKQIIVCESAKFGGFKNSDFDILVDEKSVKPGYAPYEKLCSGAYLGAVALEVLHIAAKEGLFTKEFGDELAAIKSVSTIEVNEFLHKYAEDKTVSPEVFSHANANPQDAEILFELFDALVNRMAQLAAVILASCITQCGEGHDKAKPICIACNGTTFFKTYKVIDRTKEYLKNLIGGKGLYYEFLPNEVDITTGTAMAAFTL